MPTTQPPDPSELPFVAPCRDLTPAAPWRWLRKGWADLRAAPRQSLGFGLLTVLLSWLVSLAAWRFGNMGLYLGLVSGFVFIGPWLALTLYAISLRLERGQPVTLAGSLRDAGSAIGSAMVFAVILVVVLLVWARAANTMYVFYPQISDPSPRDLLIFLAAGSAVGAVFSAVVFAVSAFSLPMLIDRQADAVTAVVTSVNAVLRNKVSLLVWALIIVASVAVAALTAWLAFIVLMPVLGHATWHAYRDTIDAEAWPPNPLRSGP
jgi:uncharacterized membrane protein